MFASANAIHFVESDSAESQPRATVRMQTLLIP